MMTTEATRLLDAAVTRVGLRSSFSPADIGENIGLTRHQAEAAARDLSNAGILELGFDCSATFSSAYRKMKSGPAKTAEAKPAKSRSSARKKATT